MEFERISNNLPNNKVDKTRSKFSDLLLDHRNKLTNKSDPKLKLLQKFVNENKEKLIVTKSDKGNVTVLLNKSDYFNNCSEMLNNKETYLIPKKPPKTSMLEKVRDKIISRWYAKNYINEQQRCYLSCKDNNLPRMYFLPKIHKPVLKFRPILSSVDTTLHRLGRKIHEIIKQANINIKSHINNSLDLKNKIRKLKIPKNYILISLDVTSLFTNVPLTLVKEALETEKEKFKIIEQTEVFNAIEMITNNTYFIFNNTVYKQILSCLWALQ